LIASVIELAVWRQAWSRRTRRRL